MQHGICLLSLVPCRKEASNTSEMVTQLLFGETYSILDSNDEWLKIQIAYDQYEC
ncbi:MAG TPA: hydrolase Nlp/P60, partial [Bacteroidia bacterium]|nr:hydrolase Nlp/P60 [Bacteroidia bacterium]